MDAMAILVAMLLAALNAGAGVFMGFSAATKDDQQKRGMRFAGAAMLFAFLALGPAALTAQMVYDATDNMLYGAFTMGFGFGAAFASLWIGGRVGARCREGEW